MLSKMDLADAVDHENFYGFSVRGIYKSEYCCLLLTSHA